MRKNDEDCLSLTELHAELKSGLQRLSELAVFLNVQQPVGITRFNQLSENEIKDLYTTSRASHSIIQRELDEAADRLIAYALETGIVFPGSSEPSE